MPYLVVRELGTERMIALQEPETSIGRSRQNPVRLSTEQSSRKHCIVKKAGAGWKVHDLGSSNGTFVNGLKIDEKDLSDGDLIGIGQATITYKDGEAPKAPAAPPESQTARIPLQDRNVQVLLQTVIAAPAAASLDEYLQLAVDNIVEITQAERGALFLREGGELKAKVARDRERRPLPDVSGMSRSIPQQVLESNKAIYLLDTEQEKDSVQSQSVSIYHLRTVMCAPLRVGDKVHGVMYVDSHAKAREYSAADLALFEGVTNYLAATIENLRAARDREGREAERRRTLERENAVLRGALERRQHLVGECPQMKAVYETLRKVAPTDATVLIQGESGTGKEAIAHVIHDLSPRSGKPFVVIDCAAIPETLLESELFGYEKGAFTGAAGTKPGKFELAQGGTLFLDEIGELSPALQVKLLRALEQKTVMRVGATEAMKIDARVVTATNRDLAAMAVENKFRQDLYFRLKVVTVQLPPLRERGGDILLLAKTFLADSNAANGRAVKDFSEEATGALANHGWPGNIRELKHRIEQAVILSNHEYLSTEDLNLAGGGGVFHSLESARDLFEKGYIVKALARNGHNVTHTAKALGISRQHLQTLIKKYLITKFTDTGEFQLPG